MTAPRSWDVFVIGGASGVGKSSVAGALAQHFGVALAEADDFNVLWEHLTTPEGQPTLHWWSTHPDPFSLGAGEIAARTAEVTRVLRPAFAAVVVDRLEAERPAVLEGDDLTPELWDEPALAPFIEAGRVRGALIDEPEQVQLLANFLSREPEAGPQHLRAAVSVAFGQWLAARSRERAWPVVPTRPWETAFARLLAVAS
ncbi:hypothetical protein E7T09_19645 [Deinococcus sp. KSM4-11]|uniref:hypothetical protein n=1 Tax=Deinococcus sp. KSM4-11 TaxID=2568654 RepID=UPI0010A3600C|nr:hypothetical protein [Deinococcus sp. KSM4-11]THF84849.1 hypothetical protein E7T09_19645 [Deinococcus sp. KSM4-11]